MAIPAILIGAAGKSTGNTFLVFHLALFHKRICMHVGVNKIKHLDTSSYLRKIVLISSPGVCVKVGC